MCKEISELKARVKAETAAQSAFAQRDLEWSGNIIAESFDDHPDYYLFRRRDDIVIPKRLWGAEGVYVVMKFSGELLVFSDPHTDNGSVNIYDIIIRRVAWEKNRWEKNAD